MLKAVSKILLLFSLVFYMNSICFAQTVVTLHSGRVVEGELVEKTDDFVRIKTYDVELTFWMDEIARVDSSENIDSQNQILSPPVSSTNEDEISRTIDKAGIPLIEVMTIDANAEKWTTMPVLIKDAEKDVATTFAGEKTCEFDVSFIKAAIGPQNLYILIEFVDNISYYFETNKNQARVIGTIFFDVDNDESTGGKEFFSEKGGFESRVDIWSGVRDKNGGSSVSGGASLEGIEDFSSLEYFVEAFTSLFNPENNALNMSFKNKIRSDKNKDSISYNENYIRFKIPLSNLGLQYQKGQTIRVLLLERGSGLGGQDNGALSESIATFQ